MVSEEMFSVFLRCDVNFGVLKYGLYYSEVLWLIAQFIEYYVTLLTMERSYSFYISVKNEHMF